MEGILNAGVQAIIVIGIMSVLTMLVLHFLAQRSQQHMAETAQSNLLNMHSMGLQAIIGVNELQIVDRSLQDTPAAKP
jgi:type II secretory pathway pseudopilin PulG